MATRSKTNCEFNTVFWLDHCSSNASGWKDRAELEQVTPVLIVSCGWIIREDKKHIVMAAHINLDESGKVGHSADGDVCILKSCIKKRITYRKLDLERGE